MTDALATTAAPPADALAEYRPIADYGLLADCTTAALVSTSGSIDWLCLPHYDSPAVFARLLDPEAGHWSIAPTGEATVTRRYLPGTLVVETTFTTETGAVRLTDALAFAPGQRGHDLGKRRTPRGAAPRRGRVGRGRAAVRARPAPRVRARAPAVPDGGRRRAHVRRPQPDRRPCGRPRRRGGRDDDRDVPRRRGRDGRLQPALGGARRSGARGDRAGRRRGAGRRCRRGLALLGGRARHLRGPATATSSASARGS